MRSTGTMSVVVLLAVLAVPHLAMACTCLWGGPFAKVALSQELVVYGEVLDYYRHSMEVKVTSNGHGITLSPKPASVPER